MAAEQLAVRSEVLISGLHIAFAAVCLAAALLVADAPWPVVVWMGANAILISAGAVLGRYHYAADALAGWIVALAVWMS